MNVLVVELTQLCSDCLSTSWMDTTKRLSTQASYCYHSHPSSAPKLPKDLLTPTVPLSLLESSVRKSSTLGV